MHLHGRILIGMNMIINRNKGIWRKLFLLIAAAALAVAVGVFAWSRGVFLPCWIEWKEKKEEISEREIGKTEILLEHRHLTVEKSGEMLWESPKNVLVQDYLWCDINHDEKNELILLCWRIGRYGDAKPYWVEKDEKTWSQHIYIYQWKEGGIHPLWMASDIGMDVKEFAFDAKKRLMITEKDGKESCWDWISWGLTLVEKK